MSATGEAGLQDGLRVSASAGFTLIEALVVIAVAALASGIIFPGVERSIGFWEYRSTVMAVQAALQRARASALRQGETFRFSIGSEGDRYGVSGEPAFAMPPSVRLGAAGARAVDFYRDGSSSGGAIEVAGAGRRARFTISADTGITRPAA